MALENLYSLTEKEIANLYKELAKSFDSNALFKSVFQDINTRQRLMEVYFQEYIRAIAPDCTFYADSIQRNCVMVVFDSRKYNKGLYFFRLVRMCIKMTKMVFIDSSSFIQFVKNWDMFTSRWLHDFIQEAHFHLDLLYTKEAYRKQGLATKMVLELAKDAQEFGIDITVETHEERGLSFYEQMGFTLMNTISHPSNPLKQYCLIMRNKE